MIPPHSKPPVEASARQVPLVLTKAHAAHLVRVLHPHRRAHLVPPAVHGPLLRREHRNETEEALRATREAHALLVGRPAALVDRVLF